MRVTITDADYSKAYEAVMEHLIDPSAFGGAWFESSDKAEEWAGDVLDDAIWVFLEKLGIEVVDFAGRQ